MREEPIPDASEGLCRQLVQECLRRRYAGVVLDAMPPEGFCRTLDELLARQERQLYLPEAAAGYAPHGTALLCTALASGSLEDRLAAAAEKWGPERLALDLQRMMLDYPLSRRRRGHRPDARPGCMPWRKAGPPTSAVLSAPVTLPIARTAAPGLSSLTMCKPSA